MDPVYPQLKREKGTLFRWITDVHPWCLFWFLYLTRVEHLHIPQALLERGSAPLRLIAFLAQMKFVPVHAVAELRIKSLRKANPWGIEIPV
uniref:Uncharacterized protein n=1 Tax=Oryza rufipogon TaxID=4529 RepID=A0A0E0RI26_ORYRU